SNAPAARHSLAAGVADFCRRTVKSLATHPVPIYEMGSHERNRFAGHQRLVQPVEHDFYIGGLVLDPARDLATPRTVHDSSGYLLDCVPDRICGVSRPGRGKVI